ncbi:MAG: Succinyl-CoA ligase [ADP-forming] alpha chain [Deltaproteobacteria bacterium]|jgi:succinyl-CoA synthetase alpha subunit|nr:Succinyl-CoA ligase [ADP-forming] alpha chain [Deltaproteobacteria bacterium]
MSILIDEKTRVVVQGITGRMGAIQTMHMLKAGTKITAGVTPGRGGSRVEGVPVYDSVEEARAEQEINTSVLFVPGPVAEESCMEAVDAGLKLLILITEHIPTHDTMRIRAYARSHGATLIGPTTPGVITPGKCKIGIMPTPLFIPGPVGIISRSGTMSYEMAGLLSTEGIGQTTMVGMGGDPVVGTSLVELLELFQKDPATRVVVVHGEIGGTQEERAAVFIRQKMTKPIIAYMTGKVALEGSRMGHAGAVFVGRRGAMENKIKAFREAGVPIADTPGEIAVLVRKALGV